MTPDKSDTVAPQRIAWGSSFLLLLRSAFEADRQSLTLPFLFFFLLLLLRGFRHCLGTSSTAPSTSVLLNHAGCLVPRNSRCSFHFAAVCRWHTVNRFFHCVSSQLRTCLLYLHCMPFQSSTRSHACLGTSCSLCREIPLAYLNYIIFLMRQNNPQAAKTQMQLFFECCQNVTERASQLNKEVSWRL